MDVSLTLSMKLLNCTSIEATRLANTRINFVGFTVSRQQLAIWRKCLGTEPVNTCAISMYNVSAANNSAAHWGWEHAPSFHGKYKVRYLLHYITRSIVRLQTFLVKVNLNMDMFPHSWSYVGSLADSLHKGPVLCSLMLSEKAVTNSWVADCLRTHGAHVTPL